MATLTPHNGANKGDFAKTVLMPGDPLRAKFIAETYLDDPKLVTGIRNVYGYTGTYRGVPVSVQGTGMGMPSMGIYSWELITEYDATSGQYGLANTAQARADYLRQAEYRKN